MVPDVRKGAGVGVGGFARCAAAPDSKSMSVHGFGAAAHGSQHAYHILRGHDVPRIWVPAICHNRIDDVACAMQQSHASACMQ